MKILHIASHLGGGVGKAHVALAAHLPGIERSYVLLEEPNDTQYTDTLDRHGISVTVADTVQQVERMARDADVVQLEYWGHHLLDQFLAAADFGTAKLICWAHRSGLHEDLFAPGLVDRLDHLVLTSTISRAPTGVQSVSIINSGFGLTPGTARYVPRDTPHVTYLGTVGFAKMHRGFFGTALQIGAATDVWGHVLPDVAATVVASGTGVYLRGYTRDPASVLVPGDIFLYLLQSDHYGTAENALVEAMSAGLVPVVLDNPAEAAIVTDGKTGFVVRDLDEAVMRARLLLTQPFLRERMSLAAIQAARLRSPAVSAQQFVTLWRELVGAPAGVPAGVPVHA